MRARSVFLCLLSVTGLVQVNSSQSSPATMMKLVVHLQSPDVPERSFSTQPKTMYRAGTRYCRIEEQSDIEHGIHGLVVINEPDAWLVNLVTKTAQHRVDRGPTFNCRLPIFTFDLKSGEELSSQLMKLEFGQELVYFRIKGTTAEEGPILQGKTTKSYTIQVDDSRLQLFTSGTPEHPIAVARQHANRRDVYWYESYEEIPFDPKLFTEPDEVKVENGK
jgi:hypothetical protein